LGYVVFVFSGIFFSEAGMEPDETKFDIVWKYPTPRNPKEVKKFLGFSSFYRRYVPGYAKIASPLRELLRKGCKVRVECGMRTCI
jgi:hypothetical protein